jgi:hypothetical protein
MILPVNVAQLKSTFDDLSLRLMDKIKKPRS